MIRHGNPSRFRRFLVALLAVAAAGLLSVRHAGAEIADLAQVPLANSPSDAVLPNLMYVLDDSGSMAWNYMPDHIFRTSDGDDLNNCKRCTSTSSLHAAPGGPRGTRNGWQQCGNDQKPIRTPRPTPRPPDYGEAPFYASGLQQDLVQPEHHLRPGIDYQGTSLGNANPTARATTTTSAAGTPTS